MTRDDYQAQFHQTLNELIYSSRADLRPADIMSCLAFAIVTVASMSAVGISNVDGLVADTEAMIRAAAEVHQEP